MKRSNKDILKNDRVVKMWKELKPLTKEELDELRIPAYKQVF